MDVTEGHHMLSLRGRELEVDGVVTVVSVTSPDELELHAER